MQVTGVQTCALPISLSLNESAGASDTDQGQYATSQEILEAVQVNDLAGAMFHALLTQNLSALASDSVSLKANYGLTLSESANAVDSVTGRATLLATIAEALSASDTFGGFSPSVYTLTIGEAVTALDSVSAALAGLRGLITATITIEPMITGAATTGTITVS